VRGEIPQILQVPQKAKSFISRHISCPAPARSMPGVHSKEVGGCEPAWLAGHWRKRDVLYWAAVAASVPVIGRALWWTAEKSYNLVTPYHVRLVVVCVLFACQAPAHAPRLHRR